MSVPVDPSIGPRTPFVVSGGKVCTIPLVFSLLISLFVALADSPSGEHDKNQLEASAKLVVEGKALEAQGKLAEAKDKYIDALAIVPNPDALNGIERINDAEKQQTLSFISEAKRLYDAGKFSDSAEQLRRALQIQPANAISQYDLALCYLKLNDRTNAALHLDMAIGSAPNEKAKLRLVELRTMVLLGTPQPGAAPDNDRQLTTFNESYIQEDRDPGDSKARGGSICQQTSDLLAAYPANPAVVFNAAKCAEEDARPGDAAHQLADYARLAPTALDNTDAAALAERWQALAAIPGDSGQTVRRDFANASRYLDYRRYDRAISEYEEAAKVVPGYPETEWQLALLYEAYGDVAKSQEHFSRLKQLETDLTRKTEADAHTANLERRRAVYDANVERAQDILTSLLMPALGLSAQGTKHKTKLTYRQWRWASARYKQAARATEKLPAPYVERELSRAREDLESAMTLFPLGSEANELMALINLQGNNWPEAYMSYDAVAAHGFPASFYAQVSSGSDSKVVRATKVEVGHDEIRLVYLSTYNPKKQISEPPDKPAGDDDLGNLVVSTAHPPDPDAETKTIKIDDVKAISTDKNFVVVKLANEQIYLSPLNMMGDIPFEGGASRSFGNEYTRLFIRYLGFEDAKLGKEGMTGGEKFMLGFEIARIGAAGAAMGMGPGMPSVYGRAKRLADLIHALKVFREVAQGARAADIADAATRLADDLQESVETLERTAGDQRRAIEGATFKAIPSQSASEKFSEKL